MQSFNYSAELSLNRLTIFWCCLLKIVFSTLLRMYYFSVIFFWKAREYFLIADGFVIERCKFNNPPLLFPIFFLVDRYNYSLILTRGQQKYTKQDNLHHSGLPVLLPISRLWSSSSLAHAKNDSASSCLISCGAIVPQINFKPVRHYG